MMVEFHLGIDDLPCPKAIKDDLQLDASRYAQLTGAKSFLVSSVIFHPPNKTGSRSYTVRAKLSFDHEDLLFSHADEYDLEEAVTKSLLGLASQLRQRLFFLQWQAHQDIVHAQ